MISRIAAIYQEVYSKSSMAEIKDKKLSEALQKEIDNIPDYKALTRDEIEDIMYIGSSTGQAQGFREGFRYAVALLVESLIS